jgi:hypothetical protein
VAVELSSAAAEALKNEKLKAKALKKGGKPTGSFTVKAKDKMSKEIKLEGSAEEVDSSRDQGKGSELGLTAAQIDSKALSDPISSGQVGWTDGTAQDTEGTKGSLRGVGGGEQELSGDTGRDLDTAFHGHDGPPTSDNRASSLPSDGKNGPEKRPSRSVRAPKRSYEDVTAPMHLEESEYVQADGTDSTCGDATLAALGPEGASEGAVKGGENEEEDEEEGLRLAVTLPDDLTPGPDPSSYLSCVVYSMSSEEAFYSCCLDQVLHCTASVLHCAVLQRTAMYRAVLYMFRATSITRITVRILYAPSLLFNSSPLPLSSASVASPSPLSV